MMKKLIILCIATLIVPLFSIADDTPSTDDWLSENVILSIEIKQTDQPAQKFSMITAKKKFRFDQTMQFKIDSPSTEPIIIILEFQGKLNAHQKDKYLLDSRLVFKIPNFICPGDKDLPFIEHGWQLGLIVSEGKMMTVVDNTDLKISLLIKEIIPEEK